MKVPRCWFAGFALLFAAPARGSGPDFVRNGDFAAGSADWAFVTVSAKVILGTTFPQFNVQSDKGPCDPQPGNPRLYIDVPSFTDGYATQVVGLPPTAPTLSFRSWGSHDPVSVTVSIETLSDGMVYDLGTFTPPLMEGDPGCSGYSPDTKSYDLSDFSGQTVSLRLRAFGDAHYNGTIASFDNVSIVSSNAAPSTVDSGDYNGDGTSDIATFRGSSGMWSVRNITRAYLGDSADRLVSADYNGDGTSDIAIFRIGSGMWSVRGLTRFYLGSPEDRPVPGDYAGAGTAEAGIFRPSSGLWSIRNTTRVYLGSADDTVIPGYYDADDTKDIAVFRGSSGMWSVRNLTRFYFGASTDDLVPGDYGGAGKWEAGIFRPSSSLWSIRGVTRIYLGGAGDWALPADYDGNGADDAAIFRASAGMWSARNLTRIYFGAMGDVPVTR